MARKASENKTGVAEKAEAVDVTTAAAEQAVPATATDKPVKDDPALVNTGVDNKTVTASNEAEVKTADSETGGASGETEASSDGADSNPDASDEEANEAGESDDETGDTPDGEKQKTDATGNGFRFNVSADGLVEVISEKRAGKSVTGATGDIITFDDKGYAKVKLEDAVHFSQVPGFSFQ